MSLKTSRRNFLKGVCATGVAGALGTSFGLKHKDVFAATTQAEPVINEYKGLCLMCKHGGCSNIATVEDGVLVSVRGNPDAERNRGTLCARGKSTIMHTYNPYRIKAPMKRTNPVKGMDVDPMWEEITWEEAINTCAAKWKAIRDHDPREMLVYIGFGMSEFTMNGLMSEARFPRAFGTPNVTTTKGQFCAIHYGGSVIQATSIMVSDNSWCDYHIVMGRGAGVNSTYANGDARGMVATMKENMFGKPMKVVSIDPVCSVEASMGEWIPIRPGADFYFLMGMTYEMLKNDWYDKDFVRDRTNGPYLIIKNLTDSDAEAIIATKGHSFGSYPEMAVAGAKAKRVNGHYLRGSNGHTTVMEGSVLKEWDKITNNSNVKFESGEFTIPKGSSVKVDIVVDGNRDTYDIPDSVLPITVEPSFAKFKAHHTQAAYSPDVMGPACEVPPADIRRIAEEFTFYALRNSPNTFKYEFTDGSTWETLCRPAVLITNRGISNHEDGTIVDNISKIINGLIGNFYMPGGHQGVALGRKGGSGIAFDPRDCIINASGEASRYHKGLGRWQIPIDIPADVRTRMHVGGTQGSAYNQPGFIWPPAHMDLHGVFPHRHSTNTICNQVLVEGPQKWGFDYEPKGLIVAGGNSILANGSGEMCVEAIRKLDFVVNFAYHHDEMTMMSDILIASPSMLETEGFQDYMGTECSMSINEPGFVTNQTARMWRNPIPLIYNTKEPNQVTLDIAWKMGMGPALNDMLNAGFLRAPSLPLSSNPTYKLDINTQYTFNQIFDRALKTTHGEQHGLDYLKENQFLPVFAEHNPAADSEEAKLYPGWHMEARNMTNPQDVAAAKGKDLRYQIYVHSQMESGEYLFDCVYKNITNNPDMKTLTAGDKHTPAGAKKKDSFDDYMGVSEEYLSNYFSPLTQNITARTKIYVNDPDYPLVVIAHRVPHSFFRIGGLDCNPWILDWNNRFNPYYNSVLVHPDAPVWIDGVKKTGKDLKDLVDTVIVESHYKEPKKDPVTGDDTAEEIDTIYRTQGRVHVTSTIHPGACIIPGALGRYNKTLGLATSEQVCLNKLLNGKLGYISPIHGGIETSCRVRVYKTKSA